MVDFVIIREGTDFTKCENTDCEQHGGNCCASGYCCNHGSNNTESDGSRT